MICPQCQCPDLYKEKAFPKKLGLSILGVAVLFSFWTYHISLLVAAVIDALIYKFVPQRAVCYRCRHTVTGLEIPVAVKGFDHHTNELYRYGH